MSGLSKAATAVGVVALLIVGAGGYALASSNGSTITVCINHHGGTLYKARKCAKHDKKLSWNKQGPKGATGPQGSQGPQGQQGLPGQKGTSGAPGTARAYAWVRSGTTPSLDPNRTKGFTAVAHPGGNVGYYCLTFTSDINASQVAPAVSVVWNSGFAGVPEYAHPVDPSQVSGTFACTGNAIEVVTLAGTTPTATSSLDFTVVVP